MSNRPDPFHRDRLVRNAQFRPIGRVIISDTYEKGADRIYCVLMTIPKQLISKVKGQHYYIDGEKYIIAKDTPDVRFSGTKLEHKVNSFYLEKVE